MQANTPTKLIVSVDVSALRRGDSPPNQTVSYGKSPSFRVNLTCRK
ncbi:hypothetical protein LAJ19_08625 [Deinococcus taeanensis]|nr:hypothetical protein [Deinococcus taeanensis]UBV41715.1 hypothetical protein LAJ19_08625 [Deinococcus taeanensis]